MKLLGVCGPEIASSRALGCRTSAARLPPRCGLTKAIADKLHTRSSCHLGWTLAQIEALGSLSQGRPIDSIAFAEVDSPLLSATFSRFRLRSSITKIPGLQFSSLLRSPKCQPAYCPEWPLEPARAGCSPIFNECESSHASLQMIKFLKRTSSNFTGKILGANKEVLRQLTSGTSRPRTTYTCTTSRHERPWASSWHRATNSGSLARQRTSRSP